MGWAYSGLDGPVRYHSFFKPDLSFNFIRTFHPVLSNRTTIAAAAAAAAANRSFHLLRSHTKALNPLLSQTLRYSTKTTSKFHQENHEYLQPNEYLGSWTPPKSPKEAEAKLDQLRKDYAKKVREVRKEYAYEVEMQRIEEQRKEEVKREALRKANEEKKKLKALSAAARAAERKVAEEEFRKTIMKEKAEKYEVWKMREKSRAEKKKEKNERLRLQSSVWIDEPELERKILEAIVDTKSL